MRRKLEKGHKVKRSVFQEMGTLVLSWQFLLAVLVFALPGMILASSLTFKVALDNLLFGSLATMSIIWGIGLVKWCRRSIGKVF